MKQESRKTEKITRNWKESEEIWENFRDVDESIFWMNLRETEGT